jgi:hypothetical protein
MTGPDLHLPTTVGTYALERAMTKSNAPVVDLVRMTRSIINTPASLQPFS